MENKPIKVQSFIEGLNFDSAFCNLESILFCNLILETSLVIAFLVGFFDQLFKQFIKVYLESKPKPS